MKLYVVRHGETDWNVKGILQGDTDIPLNGVGVMQANRVQKILQDMSIDLCFSSPFERTRNTANIICNEKIPIQLDRRLEERGFGELEGKNVSLYDSKIYWNYSLNSSANGVESVQKFISRVTSFYEELKEKYRDETILIVTHGAVVRALHYIINGYNKDTNFMTIHVPNCHVFEYEIEKKEV